MPRDRQQVIVVADKSVEAYALIRASDLQRRGRVSCKKPNHNWSGSFESLVELFHLTDVVEDFVHQVFESWEKEKLNDQYRN